MSSDSKFVLSILAIFVEVAVILVINAASVFNYLYYFLLTIIVYRLLVRKRGLEPLSLYAFYSLLIIGLYLLQYWCIPEYLGFSGTLGFGTDDSRYFWQIADSLPPNFPVPPYFSPPLPYCMLVKFVTVLPIHHPLDALFFNALGAVFIPVFTREVAFMLTGQRRAAETAFKLVMWCPFILLNSLVLIREGWVTALSIGAIYFLLKKRYLSMLALTALTFYLRIGSGLLLLVGLFSFIVLQVIRRRTSVANKFLYVCGVAVIGVLVVLPLSPTIHSYWSRKGSLGNLFRENFFESFVTRHNPDAQLVKLYRHGLWARILFGVPYFLSAPFFSLDVLVHNGMWIPRGFLRNIFAVAFVFYFGRLVQGILKAWQDKNLSIKVITAVFFASILIISQLSLQIRHKTMLMPLLYIVVAYGYHNKNRIGTLLGKMGAVALVAIQAFVLLRGG